MIQNEMIDAPLFAAASVLFFKYINRMACNT